MGIVILAKERGKGYSKQGLELLLDRAFKNNDIALLQNYFESTRAADHIHKLFGFKEVHREDNIVHLLIKKEDYLRGNKPAK